MINYYGIKVDLLEYIIMINQHVVWDKVAPIIDHLYMLMRSRCTCDHIISHIGGLGYVRGLKQHPYVSVTRDRLRGNQSYFCTRCRWWKWIRPIHIHLVYDEIWFGYTRWRSGPLWDPCGTRIPGNDRINNNINGHICPLVLSVT